jgi:rubrerythrin
MDRERLFGIFKEAIEDEQKAHHFYLNAAAATTDTEIKKTFEELARTELYHAEILQEKYKELRERTS